MDLKDELDPRFAERQWRAQRVGWALLALLIGGAMAGVFGTSPFAGKVETVEMDGARYEVEYPRFTRYQHHDRIHVRVHAPGAQGDELRIAFSREHVENMAVEGSTPEADGGGIASGAGVYAYKVEDWSRTITVAFAYEPRKVFWNPGSVIITAGEGEPVEIPLAYWTHP